MIYTKREKKILRSINTIEIKYLIRGNDEFTKKIYRELAKSIQKKGIKSLTKNEINKLSKIGGYNIIIMNIVRALKGYI